MAQYVYKGLTEEEKKAVVSELMKGITPPEPRGQPAVYRIDKDDDEDVKEHKRALKAKWLKMREKETVEEVDARDKSMTLLDIDKKVVFERGKPVEVLAEANHLAHHGDGGRADLPGLLGDIRERAGDDLLPGRGSPGL